MNTNITIIRADITRANVDAIVNAANSVMLGGGGVDGAIHLAAGPQLLEYCRQVPQINAVRCPVGEARITPAGKLAAKWVIHTVGPRYDSDPNPPELLACAYRNSLKLAKSKNCRSIAFPAISCGVYGYPHREAAEISVTVASESKWRDIDILFYLFEQKMTDIWQHALSSMYNKNC